MTRHVLNATCESVATTLHRILALLLVAASLSAASALECGSFQVLGRTDYDAFGTLIDRTGTTDNSFLYCGERWDANLGFYYLRARYMNPGTGRFWTMDEWEGSQYDPRSLHKYLYAIADPVNREDPSGRSFTGSCVEVMSAVSTMVLMAQSQLTAIIQRVGPWFAQGGSRFWAALRQYGSFAEGWAKQVIDLVSSYIPRLFVQQNIQRGNRFIDFVLTRGNQVLDIEVKYKIPSRQGEALFRLVDQLRSSINVGEGQTLLWTFKEPTVREMQLLWNELGPLVSKVQFAHGLDGLAKAIFRFFEGY